MLVNHQHMRTIWPNFSADWQCATVSIIDQTKLPHVFSVLQLEHLQHMLVAIKSMQVRGAPLIGAAAGYGMALATKEAVSDVALQQSAQALLQSRPTAVNLQWAVQRMLDVLLALPENERLSVAWQEAALICDEDVRLNQAIAQHGLTVLASLYSKWECHAERPLQILTHCNAGWLATVDVGTALAPIYAAQEAGLALHVWVDETRPRNQGAHLTAWELEQQGIPYTVICDNTGGHLMQQGQVDLVLVGADRVTSQGDVCNKIGTYLKALAAFDNKVPFYAAVPSPTIDWTMATEDIVIEERSGHEVACMAGQLADGSVAEVRLFPTQTRVANPAFDVTPARLVTGIITERGVVSPQQLNRLE